MRCYWLVVVMAGLLLGGCDNQPRANRGVPKKVDHTLRPHAVDEMYSSKTETFGDDSDGKVRFGGLSMSPPEGWTRKPTQSSFIQAEFVLPRTQGDDADGRLTLSVAGGSIEANIDRWKGQFGGGPEKSSREQIDANGIKITCVDFSGEYNDQRGPSAPAAKQSGYRMIVAIIPVNGQLHFVKGVGPQKTMDAHADRIKVFVRSAKANE
jgi:hypothetical protein